MKRDVSGENGAIFLKIAHRGYSERYPENTLPAFEKAIVSGTDMIEFDVHLSRDQHIVVIHDDHIDRTSNGRGKVRDMTLSQLKRFNYDNGMAGHGFVEIPTLEETLDLVGTRVVLNIEIKKKSAADGRIVEPLCLMLQKKGIMTHVIVSSFDSDAIRDVKRTAPEIKTALIYDRTGFPFRETIRELGVYSVHPSLKVIDADQLEWAKSCGLMVYPWVAKSRGAVAKCRAAGFIDGVMVNDLELFYGEKVHGI